MNNKVSLRELIEVVLELQLLTLREIKSMSNDFSLMSAAVDALTSEIAEAVALLQNPVVDNNDQATIDGITARLSGAADALKAALPVESAPAPVEPALSEDSPATAETPADPTA